MGNNNYSDMYAIPLAVLAKQGDVDAMVELGRRYISADEKVLSYNPSRAQELFKQAASRGDARAKYYLKHHMQRHLDTAVMRVLTGTWPLHSHLRGPGL